MKNKISKSAHHVKYNTFKFEKFSERLAKVNIDVVRRIEQRSETPDGVGTFFCETILKWNDLNCTDSYANYKNELPVNLKTLPQLLLYKEEVVECTLKHLEIQGSKAYTPLLELVVSLARDLQSDFYAFYPRIFKVVVILLKTRNLKLLEDVFKCLSYLFKFLWRYMIKDLENVFQLYCPLLDGKRPAHIRNFASESIAFLLRKVPDKNLLLDLLFSSLKKNFSLVEGIGMLLFEVLRGVQNRFHSHAPELFYLILCKLGKGCPESVQKFRWQEVTMCQSTMLVAMLHFTTQECSSLIWETFLRILATLRERCQLETTNNFGVDHLGRVLKLFSLVVTFRKGTLLPPYEVENVANTIISILEIKMLSESQRCGEHLIAMSSSMLLSPVLELNVVLVEKLIHAIFDSMLSKEFKFDFLRSMYTYSTFEQDILPHCVAMCHHELLAADEQAKEEVLTQVTELILNYSPQLTDSGQIEQWKKFNLETATTECGEDFGYAQFVQYLLSILTTDNIERDKHRLWMAILCLPHLNRPSISKLLEKVKNLFQVLLHKCKEQDKTEDTSFLLFHIVESFIHALDIEEFSEAVSLDDIKSLLRYCSDDLCCLRLADFYFTYLRDRIQSQDIFANSILLELFPSLQLNLCSPHRMIRLLTLRILSRFRAALPKLGDRDVATLNVFQLCLAAESVELTVQDFRERLRHLHNLEYYLVRPSIPIGPFEKVPLYYTLGTLYINFQPLMLPTINLVDTYARGMKPEAFWEVYSSFLSEAADRAERRLENRKHKGKYVDIDGDNIVDGQEIEEEEDNGAVVNTGLRWLYNLSKGKITTLKDRVDYARHREHLWKAMMQFPEIAQNHTEILSTLLLRCVVNECGALDVKELSAQNVQKKSRSNHSRFEESLPVEENEEAIDEEDIASEESIELENSAVEVIEEEDVEVGDIDDDANDDDGDDDNDVQNADYAGQTKKRSKSSVKVLRYHLELFSKFHKPESVSRESELNKIYVSLLEHPAPSLQKIALDCIFSYSHKYINPYKDNLLRLLDAKSFRRELTLFSIDVENGVVLEEHRSGLMPVLIRILLGRMVSKTANKSASSSTEAKQKMILEYMSMARQDEMQSFLELAFLPFHRFLEGDVLSLVHTVMTDLDFTAVVPLKKQEGALRFLEIVFKKLGNRVFPHLPWLFKILMSAAARATVLLEHRDHVAARFLPVLKKTRTLAITKIIQFFEAFENYAYTREEIDALFEAIVWPQLPRMKTEGVYNPTLLFKLFQCWSKYPRYFVLLAKHHNDDCKLSPLHQVMGLLVVAYVRPSVISSVFDIIHNLATLADYESRASRFEDVDGVDDKDEDCDSGPPIQVNNEVTVNRNRYADWLEPPNYGTLLLLPHMTSILTRLKRSIQKARKGRSPSLPERNLVILCRLSEFVTNPGHCSGLLKLLVPFLSKSSSENEESQLNIFNIIKSLLKGAKNPKKYLHNFVGLFSTVTIRQSREILCQLLDVIASRDSSVQHLADVSNKINAWNPKRADEPDYALRLEGFQLAMKMMDEMTSFDAIFCGIVCHNCIFFLNTTQDMSLLDNSTLCLQKMAEFFAKFYFSNRQIVKKILSNTILPEIRKGFKHENEGIRHEFIAVLSAYVKHCSVVPQLFPLKCLLNDDAEIDFFGNIRHIQLHRRARAFRRLIKGDQCKDMPSDTLIQYLMPIACSFLFDEDYEKHSSLVDTAISMVGYICRLLPWNHYENFLKLYLDKLPKCTDHQKTTIKLAVSVLDAFHFDLSLSEETNTAMKSTPIAMVNMRKSSNDGQSIVPEEKAINNTESDVSNVNVKKVKMNTMTNAALATQIHQTISKYIFPQLQKWLSQKAEKDDRHRLAQKFYAEDDEILRVPVAIAMVKLLKRLPKGSLESNLPGILMRICTFLKSRADSIREISRDTLLTVMVSLGPKFLHYLIIEMKSILSRGYQVHVMTFTIHAILERMKPKLRPGDLDLSLPSLAEVCHNELFGNLAEEKEVEQIVKKLKEARGTNAYAIYEIMAKYISEASLTDLIIPLKNMLADTTSHKVINKIQEVLRHVTSGLASNKGIDSTRLLIFSYGIVSESIPEFNNQRLNRDKLEETPIDPYRQRPDTFLIPTEPGRNKAFARTSARTNAHILVEFGVQLLYNCLRRIKIETAKQEVLQMLDPFVSFLSDCLQSTHIQLTTASLRCLMWILKLPLPTMKNSISAVTVSMFSLLKKYSRVGMAQGINWEMVVACFRTLTVIIREVKYHEIDEDQLRVLLAYVEQDIHDQTRQATAFALLKAILSKRMSISEIHEVMSRVMHMVVTSTVDHVQAQSRQCTLQYLLDYPHGKKLVTHLQFFVAQLEYEHDTGRQSVLELLTDIFATFPNTVLSENAAVFFIQMSARLVNDPSIKCRKMTASSLKVLLIKISPERRNELFSVVKTWLMDKKLVHCRLASQLCGLFVEVEKENFIYRLTDVFPSLLFQLKSTKYVDMDEENQQNNADQLVFQVLTTLSKAIRECDIARDLRFLDHLNRMWEGIQRHLLHPHVWVRLITCQMMGQLFGKYPIEEVVAVVLKQKPEKVNEYFYRDFACKLRSMVLDFGRQLMSAELLPEIGEQVAKNLVYFAKILKRLPKDNDLIVTVKKRTRSEESNETLLVDRQVCLSLDWLIRVLRRQAQAEVIHNHRQTFRRTCLFKWMAAIALDLDKDTLIKKLPLLMPPISREMGVKSTNEKLRSLVQEVIDLLRGLVGVDVFSRFYTAANTRITEKREGRKRDRVMRAVANPEVAARKKIKKNISKVAAKKRKQAAMSSGGGPGAKRRRKLKDLAILYK